MKTETRTLLLSSIIALCTTIALIAIERGLGSQSDAPNQPDRFHSIQAHGNLRASYAVGAPLFLVDPSTKKMSGVFFDITTRAARKLGLEVDWVQEVGYGEMTQGLINNKYDLVGSGVWINPERAKAADFSIPVYFDTIYGYVRADDKRFKNNLDNLNSQDFVISTMDGELGLEIAREDYPRAKTLTLPQASDFSQLIANVVSKKADIVFLASGPAQAYIRKHPNDLRKAETSKPLRVFGNALMIPQDQFQFRQMLDYALANMINNGEVEAILKKNGVDRDSYLIPALPYALEGSK